MEKLEQTTPAAGRFNGGAFASEQGERKTPVDNVKLCSGYGPKHTNKYHKLATVTLAELQSRMSQPPQKPKDEAQWVIFSTVMTRKHKLQREQGEFYGLWADIDDPEGLAFNDIVGRTCDVIQGDFLAYTSRSAIKENQKARIIIPLGYPVSGHEFVTLQRILNNKLEAAGITPDRVTERAGQLCYLPNRGVFYDWKVINSKGPLNPDECWSEELVVEMERQHAEQAELTERRQMAKIKARARVSAGTQSPIDAFNAEYNLPLVFDMYGYLRKGNRWLSPNSSSKSPAVSITNDGQKWLSAHESDAGIGRPCDSGNGYMGDAFDLFVYYQHGGNRDEALKDAGDMFLVNGGPLYKVNQQAFSESKGLSSGTFQGAGSLTSPQDGQAFSLDTFSLNGMAAEMESKMLEDKFILGRMAILGQSTVFYAKPNAGKTLLTIWLLIEAIKSHEIDGKNLFYINADDNHKGLTYKLKLAEKHGFQMLAPGYNGFDAKMLSSYLANLVRQDQASGKILILDTVKKFTDIMHKDKASNFGESVRQFVAHGGSVIMLAHVNKHKDDEGKVVYSGTTDLVDDADCAYTLDVVTEDKLSGDRTVKFENFKSRGDVAIDAVYSYHYGEGVNYYDRLASVRAVTDEERQNIEKQKRLNATLERNRDAIEAIKGVLRDGSQKKTELVNAAHQRSGVSKARIQRALEDHTGTSVADYQYWHLDIQDKNAHIYRLNWAA